MHPTPERPARLSINWARLWFRFDLFAAAALLAAIAGAWTSGSIDDGQKFILIAMGLIALGAALSALVTTTSKGDGGEQDRQ